MALAGHSCFPGPWPHRTGSILREHPICSLSWMEKTSQSRAIAKCQSELSGEAVEEPRDPRTVRIGGGAENPIVELGQKEGWETAKWGGSLWVRLRHGTPVLSAGGRMEGRQSWSMLEQGGSVLWATLPKTLRQDLERNSGFGMHPKL